MKIIGPCPHDAAGINESRLGRAATATLGPRPENPPGADPGAERLELVRVQNAASPQPREVDLQQALTLLGRVTQGLAAAAKPELRKMYEFDRLREFCCQLQEPAGS